MGGKAELWQSLRMHSALIFALGLGSVLVGVGAIVAVAALRRAPDGMETEEGFQFTGAVAQPAAVKTNSTGEFMGGLAQSA